MSDKVTDDKLPPLKSGNAPPSLPDALLVSFQQHTSFIRIGHKQRLLSQPSGTNQGYICFADAMHHGYLIAGFGVHSRRDVT